MARIIASLLIALLAVPTPFFVWSFSEEYGKVLQFYGQSDENTET